MPRPADGRYVLNLYFPPPIGMLHVEVVVGPDGLTCPFASGTGPLPYQPDVDMFGVPGGRLKIECAGNGEWHAIVDGVACAGTCSPL